MNKYDAAFEIALKCKSLARHLPFCRKCRRALKRHSPAKMCYYGHADVDRILYYISKFDDDWAYLEYTVDGVM